MDLRAEGENGNETTMEKRSFTQALREKYCMSDGVGFDSISVILSPKRKNATAELGHLRTIVLNNMNVMTADIPNQGLMWLCPNVVDLDLANNLFDKWSELLTILCHMPQLKFVNASKNSLNVDTECIDLPKTPLNIENLALNYTGISIEDIIHISKMMPTLKELHLCGNDYEHLGSIDESIKKGAFSSLECLRLNSNRISNWTEVWKLRHLQSLKNLILSDNPVSKFFYLPKDDINNSTNISEVKEIPQEKASEDHHNNSPEAYQASDKFDIQRDNGKKNDLENKSNNCYSTHEEFDLFHDEIDRPVSRIGRHEDSDVEDQGDQYSDEETDLNDGLPEDERNENVLNSFPWHDVNKGSTESFNTNSSMLTVTDDESFMDRTAGSESSDTDVPKDSDDYSHYTLIAESFLYDILNSIDFTQPEARTPSVENASNFELHNASEGESNTMLATNLDIENESRIHARDFDCNKRKHLSNQNSDIVVNCCEYFNYTISHEGQENYENTESNTRLPHKYNKTHMERDIVKSKEDDLTCKKCSTPVDDIQRCEQNSDCKSFEQNFNSLHNCQTSSDKNETVPDHFHLIGQKRTSNLNQEIDKSNAFSLNDICGHSEDENKTNQFNDGIDPFENLDMLCLTNTCVTHWKDLNVFSQFPKLKNLRVQCNPLYSSVDPEDRRKLYIASLPQINVLNGSEVSATEREKAERYYLRHFMHEEEKPDIYHNLVQRHGEPVELVDIDLSAGYQEWALLDFICDGERKFSKKVHLTEQVGRLRLLISQTLLMPKNCFIMHYNPCSTVHPEYERDMTELRCESLPMSRFNFADGDEIHIQVMDP